MKKFNFLAILLSGFLSAQTVGLVKDIYPGVQGSSPQGFVKLDDNIFFSANHPDYGSELWSSDGTTEGTQILEDFITGTSGQIPSSLKVFNGKIYYSAILGNTEKPSGLYSYDSVNGIKLVSEEIKWSSGFFATEDK